MNRTTLSSGWRVIVVGVLAATLGACVTTGDQDKSKTPEGRKAAAGFNLRLGAAYMQQNNLTAAKEVLDKANKESPENAEVHAMLAVLQERLGDNRKADTEHRTALRLAPENPDVQNNYAVFLCRTGKTAEGVKLFETAAANKLYRTPWVAYTNAGVCLRNEKRNDEASKELALALNANPAYTEAVFQAAELELMQGMLVEARVRVSAWLLQNPATPEMLQLGWRIAKAQADEPAATQFYNRLHQEFPDSAATRSVETPPP
ncbi:MAG TPA: type IV pilus biogenesis/stability protein PilW [Steroidobacteraceae bacterium]|nr:type IV pilus biogenesis/stability protein PilW [Steroidobacteraceae bacterium]